MVKIKEKGINTEDTKYVDELIGSIKLGMASINGSIDAAIEPLRTVELVTRTLTEQGKDELVNKVLSLTKTIRSDVESYGDEITEITSEVTKYLANTPTRPRHMERFTAESMYLGQRLIELNSRIIQTTVAIATDYSVILKEAGID